MKRTVEVLAEPPFPKGWAIKGVSKGAPEVRAKPGVILWIYWSPEGGGWWQWGPEAWRHIFASEEEARKTGDPYKAGPWFNMPVAGSVEYVEVDTPERTTYRRMIEAGRP